MKKKLLSKNELQDQLKYFEDLKTSYFLERFVMESDNIENIIEIRRHTVHQKALYSFLQQAKLTKNDLVNFVTQIEPKSYLRTKPDDNVWIGGRQAPPPNKSLPRLETLLTNINDNNITPWEAHVEYESIHPFIDGNGRSGRAVWLWIMWNRKFYRGPYTFLQMFYYQTLQKYAGKD